MRTQHGVDSRAGRRGMGAAIAVMLAALVVVLAGPAGPAGAATCPCTIFSPTATPASPAVTDGQSIEVGVKFQSDTGGLITGIRFYKGTANIGTHVGNLWTAGGTQLASATFSGETASGWQQVQFAMPVQITANTTYVASYWSSSGYFADDFNYFGANVDNAPLHALSSGSSGGNGVYRYGTSGFPTSTYQASNYWVDVVFNSSGPDTTAPRITAVSPSDGATGIDVGTSATATFDEPIDPATLTTSTFTLRDSGGAAVPAAVTYSSGSLTASLSPQAPLDYSKGYTATVKGGSSGVKDTAGNALAQDRTWSFSTGAAPPPPPDQGYGGPILVVSSTADRFGSYLPEILRTEGLNEFSTTDVSNLSASTLSNYQLVILGHTALTDAQASTLQTWVQGGGKLIAMRPDTRLAGLLGITAGSGTLGDAYLRIDTGSAPGAGITGSTMQFHGTADRYTAGSGTRSVATLYSDASTATSSPAVTLRDVGTSGGQAAAFTYDLGRSVVYTHQGNPAWAGQERDGAVDQGTTTIRPDDLFYGGALPDYVNLGKVAIPQADEQQRLLANLVTSMEADRMPVPRLWYFPNGYKAAIVMTGDEHATGAHGTEYAFDRFKSQSPANCSVADWTCVRATSYVFPRASVDPTAAKAYEDQGFEIALHLRIPGPSECNNYSSYQDVKNALDTQLDSGNGADPGFLTKYPNLQPPQTIRTHCIVWSDWDSEVRADLSRGIRLNTDYYYWPPAWVAGRSGMFTGAGIPMRYAATTGAPYDVYQATTQLPDETYGDTATMGPAATTLLDGAVGPNGYYGAFTANVHNDLADATSHAPADAIVAAAQARGVPIVSARQMLTWLDGRNGSSFQNLGYSNGRLSFTMSVGTGARGLQAMVPTAGPSGSLQGVTRDGQTVSLTTRTIKGVEYAMFSATAGAYAATYGVAAPDTTPPSITNVAAAPRNDGTATITWRTDEPATSRVQYGTSASSLTGDVTDGSRVTDHSVTLTGLADSTTYAFRVTSADAAGNSATSPATSDPPATFTTPAAPVTTTVTDTTVADFGAGTTGTQTFVGATGSGTDGEVQLAPAIGEEFAGTALPSGWSATPNVTGGTATVTGGTLTVDGARAGTTGTYAPTRSLEFHGVLAATTGQHVGFGTDFVNAPWAMFSTGGGSLSAGLYARTRSSSRTTNTAISGASATQPHRYRIVWGSSTVTYFVDGTQVASHATRITASMRPLVGDATLGGTNPVISWLRMGPYATSGTYTSRVADGGGTVTWTTLVPTLVTPSGTAVQVQTRSGATAAPDASWSAWQTLGAGNAIASPRARYLQYRAVMSGTTTTSPTLERAVITYTSP